MFSSSEKYRMLPRSMQVRKMCSSPEFDLLTGRHIRVCKEANSSFISTELVVVVSKRKLASVDVIGMENRPFEMVLGTEVAASLQKVTIISSHRV